MMLAVLVALSWLQVFLSLFSNVISHTSVTHFLIYFTRFYPFYTFSPTHCDAFIFYFWPWHFTTISTAWSEPFFYPQVFFTLHTFSTFVHICDLEVSRDILSRIFLYDSSYLRLTSDFWVTGALVCWLR